MNEWKKANASTLITHAAESLEGISIIGAMIETALEAAFVAVGGLPTLMCMVLIASLVGRGSAAKPLTKDEARRIAANIAKLPELLRKDGLARPFAAPRSLSKVNCIDWPLEIVIRSLEHTADPEQQHAADPVEQVRHCHCCKMQAEQGTDWPRQQASDSPKPEK